MKNILKGLKHRNLVIYCFVAAVLSIYVHYSLNTDDYLRTSIDLSESSSESCAAGASSCTSVYNIHSGDFVTNVRYNGSGTGYFTVVDKSNQSIIATEEFSETASTPTEDGSQMQSTVNIHLDKYASELQINIYNVEGALGENRVQFFSVDKYYSDSYLLPIMLFAVLLWFYYCIHRYRKNGNANYFIISCIVSVLTVSLINSGLIGGIDEAFHLSRIQGIAMGLSNGQFPVLINQAVNNGAGYINSILNPELFLYIPGILCYFGSSSILAYKVLITLTNLVTGIICCYVGEKIGNQRIGLIFAIFYLVSPFRMFELYTREGIGAVIAMAFLPLALYGIEELVRGDTRKGFWLTLIGMTAMLQSHIINTFIMMLFVIPIYLYYVIRYHKVYFKDWKRLKALLICIGCFVAINLWFLYPFLDCYSMDLNIHQNIGDLGYSVYHILNVFSLDDSVIDSSAYPCQSIGLHFIVIFVCFILMLVSKKKKNNQQVFNVSRICFGVAIISLLLSSDLFPWHSIQKSFPIINFLAMIEFSWRFLMMTTVSLSFLGGFVVDQLLCSEKKEVVVFIEILFCFSAYTSLKHMTDMGEYENNNKYVIYHPYTDRLYLYTGDTNMQGTGETASNTESNDVSSLAQSGIQSNSTTISIQNLDKNGTSLDFDFSDNTSSTELRLPLYGYTKLYAAKLDGQSIELGIDSNTHMLTVSIPENSSSGHVSIYFHRPISYSVSNIISLFSIFVLAYIYFKRTDCPKELTSNGPSENS